MSQPWTKEYRGLQAIGGQRNCLQLPFPQICRIVRLRVKQVGASNEDVSGAFRLSLFNSLAGCGAGESSSGGSDPDGEYQGAPDIYQIGEDYYSGSNGELSLNLENGLLYENRDGRTPMSRLDRLYVDIQPINPGLNVYDVSFTCDMDL